MVGGIRDSENAFQYVSHKKNRGASLLLIGLEKCCHRILRCLVVFTNLFAPALLTNYHVTVDYINQAGKRLSQRIKE